MVERRNLLGNLLLTLLLGFALTTIQTTVWPKFLGIIPAPPFAAMVVAYFGIYRSRGEGIILCYGLAWILGAYTAAHPMMLVSVFLALLFSARTVKSLVYWGGASYELMVATGAILLYHFFYLVLSWIVESNPISGIPILRWIGEAIVTFAFALLIFGVLRRLEKLSGANAPAGAGEL